MKLSSVLALAGTAFAAPLVVVTQTDVVVVTANPVSTATPSAATPQVGNVVQIVVSKLVEVDGDSTNTYVTTYTETKTPEAAATSATTATAAETSQAVQASNAEAQTVAAAEPTSSKETTTLTPETTQQAETTTAAPTTTQQQQTTTSQQTTAAATTTGSTDSSFATEILAAHNAKRALHGVPNLSWSSDLEAYAQAYADKYDCSGTLTHSGGSYGENLGLGYTTTGVVEAWYDEISYYDYSNPAGSHFTQVVWKSTTQLGCATKQCGSYWGQYTICSYNPAGNYAGEYSENVLPLV
jgi:uncharacterized protein YkwD